MTIPTTIALWVTQGEGGGLARLAEDGTAYVWHTVPDWMAELPESNPDSAKEGDAVPEEWGLAPANNLAMDVMDPPFDMDESDI